MSIELRAKPGEYGECKKCGSCGTEQPCWYCGNPIRILTAPLVAGDTHRG